MVIARLVRMSYLYTDVNHEGKTEARYSCWPPPLNKLFARKRPANDVVLSICMEIMSDEYRKFRKVAAASNKSIEPIGVQSPIMKVALEFAGKTSCLPLPTPNGKPLLSARGFLQTLRDFVCTDCCLRAFSNSNCCRNNKFAYLEVIREGKYPNSSECGARPS